VFNNSVVNFRNFILILKKSLSKILAFDSFRVSITDMYIDSQMNLESAKQKDVLKEAFSRLRFLETIRKDKSNGWLRNEISVMVDVCSFKPLRRFLTIRQTREFQHRLLLKPMHHSQGLHHWIEK